MREKIVTGNFCQTITVMLFVDYAGRPNELVDDRTGEIRQGQVFQSAYFALTFQHTR